MAEFVHLHVHSHYSLLDGMGKIDELIDRAQELELPALALTDHGNMYGAIEFYTKCKKAGIKPILGVEAYLAPRGMLDKVPKIDSTAYHQILLAKNEEGYRNLLFLVSEAHMHGMYYKPRIDLDLLAKYSKGLIGTSSCLAGMIPEAIASGDMEKAAKLTKRFVDIFNGDFYLELQHHPSLESQIKTNEGLKILAKELKLPLIATGDVHYVRPEDKEAQEILLAVNTGKDLTSDDRMTFGDIDVSMQGEGFFKEAFYDVPEVIANTKKIADACSLDLNIGDTILPVFSLPEGFSDDMDYVRHLTHNGAKERYTTITSTIKKRIEYELGVIAQTGFASYFLIVADFVSWAKDNGILVGPGRGSAAGSIVTYCLRISDIDPMAYDPPLLFERFLNPDRIEMPDIDLDFADDRRAEVIQYVREKYGEDHVAGIATFGTMMGRAAVRDVGRVLGLPYSEVDEIAKLIPQPVQGRHVPLKESLENVAELKAFYDSSPQIKRMLDFACQLEGTVRHASQHASAFVISKEPLMTYSPIQPATKGQVGVITQYSMKPIAAIGLLKMDFLGLSNLTVIRNALRIIRKVYDTDIDIHKIPLDDKKTFTLLARGTTTGVFQLEGEGMKRYIKELKPDRFEDIVAMVSLYRPGPMQSIPSYIARKHGREPIQYDHPLLTNSLAETYGVIVYQEQVMQASKDLAKFTGGEADTLRKAMGKKIAKLMAEMKPKFYAGCEKNGIDAKTAEIIFGKFETFSAYGFNKAHASCYAMIAYQTAYLKANYPEAFMAALLTSDAQNLDRIGIEIAECERLGIQVLPPDINESFPEFGVVRGRQGTSDERQEEKQPLTPHSSPPIPHEYIRFGLAAIKNVGHGVAEKIVEERKASGPYTSLTEFLMRLGPSVLNKRVLEALAMTGALDRFGERNALAQSVDIMTRFLANGKKSSDQMGLFSADQTSLVHAIALADVPPLDKRTSLEWEKTLLGIYLSDHPLKELENILPAVATPIRHIEPTMNGQNQRVGGLITDLRVITTKNKEAMAFAKLTDSSGVIELVVFPRLWNEAKNFVQPDLTVVADGRVDTTQGEAKLVVSRIIELHPEEGQQAILASLGPLPKTPQWQKERGTKRQETGTRGEGRGVRDESSETVNVNHKTTDESKARVILKIPPICTKSTLQQIKYILQEHVGTVPVYIQAFQGDSFSLSKTKSAVIPNPNLIVSLKSLGVEVETQGVTIQMKAEPSDTSDIEEFVLDEAELAVTN